MSGPRKTTNWFIWKASKVPGSVIARVRIIAEAEGYVMVRCKGAVPFVTTPDKLTSETLYEQQQQQDNTKASA